MIEFLKLNWPYFAWLFWATDHAPEYPYDDEM